MKRAVQDLVPEH